MASVVVSVVVVPRGWVVGGRKMGKPIFLSHISVNLTFGLPFVLHISFKLTFSKVSIPRMGFWANGKSYVVCVAYKRKTRFSMNFCVAYKLKTQFYPKRRAPKMGLGWW